MHMNMILCALRLMVRNTADHVCTVLCHHEFKLGIRFDQIIESICEILFDVSKQLQERRENPEVSRNDNHL